MSIDFALYLQSIFNKNYHFSFLTFPPKFNLMCIHFSGLDFPGMKMHVG